MPSVVQIRRYTDRDFDAVRELWLRAGLELRPSDSREELEKKLLRDPELFVVAEENRKIIGAAIGSFDGRRAFVYHLAVDPDYQLQGIGKQIMQHLWSKMRDLGAIRMLLLVDEDNLSAQQFYTNLGMQSNRMIVMSKNLLD